MANVAVVHSDSVEPRVNPDTGLTVRATLGPPDRLRGARAGGARLRAGPLARDRDRRGRGDAVRARRPGHGRTWPATAHELEPEVGVYLPPGSRYELREPGPGHAARRRRAGSRPRARPTTSRAGVVAARRPGARGGHDIAGVPDRRRPGQRPALGDALRRLHPDRPRARPLPHLRRGHLRARRRGRDARRRCRAAGSTGLVHPASGTDRPLPREHGRRRRCASSPCSGRPDRRRPLTTQTGRPHTQGGQDGNSRGGAHTNEGTQRS